MNDIRRNTAGLLLLLATVAATAPCHAQQTQAGGGTKVEGSCPGAGCPVEEVRKPKQQIVPDDKRRPQATDKSQPEIGAQTKDEKKVQGKPADEKP